jgi:hypothetical protein
MMNQDEIERYKSDIVVAMLFLARLGITPEQYKKYYDDILLFDRENQSIH